MPLLINRLCTQNQDASNYKQLISNNRTTSLQYNDWSNLLTFLRLLVAIITFNCFSSESMNAMRLCNVEHTQSWWTFEYWVVFVSYVYTSYLALLLLLSLNYGLSFSFFQWKLSESLDFDQFSYDATKRFFPFFITI